LIEALLLEVMRGLLVQLLAHAPHQWREQVEQLVQIVQPALGKLQIAGVWHKGKVVPAAAPAAPLEDNMQVPAYQRVHAEPQHTRASLVRWGAKKREEHKNPRLLHFFAPILAACSGELACL
jgi:hypothetical protein